MKILCYGDSNTYGYDPRSYIGSQYPPQYRWVDVLGQIMHCKTVNAGENGRRIPRRQGEQLIFERLLTAQEPVDLLIVMLGINDLLQGSPVAAVIEQMESFLKSIPLDKNKILLIGIPPVKLGTWIPAQNLIHASEELNQEYKALAQRLHLGFADAGKWDVLMSFDGVHFTEEGHIAFAEGLCNYLKKEKTYAGNWNEST